MLYIILTCKTLGRVPIELELTIQVPVSVIKFNRVHVGDNVVGEQEHVVVGDAADHVVVEYQAVLVADDDGDILQLVRHGKDKRITVVTQFG